MPLKTCPSPQLLQRFVDGRCSKSESEGLAGHLQSCQACTQTVQVLRGLSATTDWDNPSASLAGHAGLIETFHDQAADVPTGGDADKTPARSAAADAPRSPDTPAEPFSFLNSALKLGEIGRLGPYSILKMLGEGGMGVVFEAKDTNLDRLVALKVLRPEQAANEQSRQRFVQEAKIVAALQHDHIITIYQVGEERGLPFFAMQLLQGTPLDRLLKQRGQMSVPDVVRIGREVAEGLAVAHARNLVHRDIKPANIWLEHSGKREGYRVKILDFGLARNVSDAGQHLTRTGVIMGTPGYMAPEQARSVGADHRSDLFSLGCVLYHACAGQEPFPGEDVMAVLIKLALEEPQPLNELNPEAPYYLVHLIERMMAKNPEDRPESAAEIASILATAQQTVARTTDQSIFVNPAVRPPDERTKPGVVPAGKASRAPAGRASDSATAVGRAAPSTAGKPVVPSGRSRVPANGSGAPAAPVAKPVLDDLSGPCPRCGAPRRGKATRGWCQACGYHPELKEDDADQEQRPKSSTEWIWLMVGGILFVAGLSVAAHVSLRPDSLPRARWGVAQLALGVVFLVIAQIWAWLVIFRTDTEASLFAPIKVWINVVAGVPRTRHPLYMGSWSLTAMICAVLVVGGQSYWLDHMKRKAPLKGGGDNVTTITRHPAAERNWEDSIEEFTNTVQVVDAPYDLSPKPDDIDFDTDNERNAFGVPRVMQRFTVVGYTGRPGMPFSSLVLAQEAPGNLVYVGTVHRGFSFKDRDAAKKKMKNIKTALVSAAGVDAQWVEPTLTCNVEYAMIDSQGLLVDPIFKGW